MQEAKESLIREAESLIREAEAKASRARFNPSSLRGLAIDCAARSMPPDDPRLAPGRYPKKLRDEIMAFRSGIISCLQ